MAKKSLTPGALARLAGLALFAAALAAAARAQENGATRPRLLLGDNPKAYDAERAKKHALFVPATDPAKKPSILWLRPNQEAAFFLYVVNPSPDDVTVRVKLVTGDGSPVAESAAQTIPGREKTKDAEPRRVSLARSAPPKEPAPPKEAPAKEPTPGVKGEGLPPQFQIQLFEVTKDKNTGKEEEKLAEQVAVGIMVPNWYVTPEALYNGGEQKRLSVSVAPIKQTFAGGECPVQLAVYLPDPKTGLPTLLTKAKEATLERSLSAGQSVELSVVDPRLAALTDTEKKQKSYVVLNVDGYERAFRFEGGFEARSGDTPLPRLTKPSLRLQAPPAWASATDYPVRLGVDDILGTMPVDSLDVEVTLQLDFGRDRGKDGFDSYERRLLPGHRLQRVWANPATPEGALVFKTDVHDWDVLLPTKGLFGKRDLRVLVLKKDKPVRVEESRGPEDPAVYLTVMLDGTPPEITKLGVRKERPEADGLPKLEKGNGRLAMYAVGSDPESGIKQVLFFLGKPAADPKTPGVLKMPEGADPVEGVPSKEEKGEPTTWVAQLPVKADKPGSVDVSVQFVNGAGLVTFGTVQVELVDAKGGGKGLGNIEGKVLEGDRPQPGLEVTLRDAQNAIKATAVTDKKTGVYKFTDLPPGPYRVSASKTTSGTRGETPVQVEADKTKTADITLFR
jgi:hypothetical protein